MNIKIHRGLEQIGGCITEINTKNSRVFIDMGQNLPGNGDYGVINMNQKQSKNLKLNNYGKRTI